MRFTGACRYAVRALAHLAKGKDNPPVASHIVARACGIPEQFLTKILKPLVSVRVLYSLKGPNGGYRLARPAKEITLLEIVEAVDGPLHGSAPTVETRGAKLDARLAAVCEQAADAVRKQLAKVRLSDLAGK